MMVCSTRWYDGMMVCKQYSLLYVVSVAISKFVFISYIAYKCFSCSDNCSPVSKGWDTHAHARTHPHTQLHSNVYAQNINASDWFRV